MAAPLQREAAEPNLTERDQECNIRLQDVEEGRRGIQAERGQGGPTTTSGLLSGLSVAKAGLLIVGIALLLTIPAFQQGDRLCFETDGVRNCQHDLTLGLPEPGPPGEECKVLVTVHGHDQPCCYKPQALGLNHEVCFEEQNVLMNNVCRNRSTYPEVKMLGNNCKLTLKYVTEQDAGCYDFFMPHNSKEPLYHKCVDLDTICPFTIKHVCLLSPLVQFLWCVFILTLCLVLACKKNFGRVQAM